MDYQSILKHLLGCSFHFDIDITASEYFGVECIEVLFVFHKQEIILRHLCVKDEIFSNLPTFLIEFNETTKNLAHVLPLIKFAEHGQVCVNDQDSLSLNFERSELIFEESIKRHLRLISELLQDEEFNNSELIREFKTNWEWNASMALPGRFKQVYCSLNNTRPSILKVFSEIENKSWGNVSQSPIIVSDAESDDNNLFQLSKRKLRKEAIAFLLHIQAPEPNIPNTKKQLYDYLLNIFEHLDASNKQFFENEILPKKAKEFWIIFNVPTSSGTSWVGLKLSSRKKSNFPNTLDKLNNWKVHLLNIKQFSKDHLMPRSGGDVELSNKKVLLVGAGSVGSEVAHKLGLSGIGELDICDPDTFSEENIYRHLLSNYHINSRKSVSLSIVLQSQFPWITATPYNDKLLGLKDKGILESHDLIVIAIGSPTHERIFDDYLKSNSIKTPVIYTWLEGYGVGGHAVLDMSNKQGCLRCSYIDVENSSRGLSSNLAFIAPDQNIAVNYAGCGQMHIPYGGIASAQTGVMAADLAIKYLTGKVGESSKVSWKGDSKDALNEDLKLTQRYEDFAQSLTVLPLIHPNCDVCNASPFSMYVSGKYKVFVSVEVIETMSTYKQISAEDVESAGLIIGYQCGDDIYVYNITEPKETDIRTRNSFELDATEHQKEVDTAYISSERTLGYFGTWHTHPQKLPSPSSIDKGDWGSHIEDNPDRQLCYIIVGTEEMRVFLIQDKEIILMKLKEDEND